MEPLTRMCTPAILRSNATVDIHVHISFVESRHRPNRPLRGHLTLQHSSIMRLHTTDAVRLGRWNARPIGDQLRNIHWLVETTQSPMIEVVFTVHEETLPALYSAIEEISNEVGARLEAPHRYDREDALTFAARSLGQLRAGIADAHAKLAKRHPRDRRWQSPLGDKYYR